MAKVIDSQALEPVNKALGLAGSGDSQTELTDGIVDQVLDVRSIVRRGRTVAGTEGVFRCVLQTTHAGSDQQAIGLNPYNPNATSAPNVVVAPYPDPVPDSFEIWLLGASVVRLSGGGTLTAGLRLNNIQQGWGIDELGDAVVSSENVIVAFWNAIQATTTQTFATTQVREPWKRLAMRIPRHGATPSGPLINFFSFVTAAAVIQCVMLIGVFPVALGQDALE